jgi:hypothetical protein
VEGNAFSLTVSGTGFLQGAVVTFHLINMPTTFISSTQLTAAIPASAIAVAGNFDVIVNNPNGFASPLVLFSVVNPAPGGAALAPPSAPAGSNALLLTVTGTGFTAASVVMVNGSPRATTFVNATTLQAMLLGSDLAQPGTLKITVVAPPPGGGTSPVLTFPVTHLIPQVNSLSPASSQAGGNSLPLQVIGSNFETSSVILVNNVARPTTYATSNTLSMSLSQSDLSTPGTLNIAVTNPAPGGGTTGTLPFTIAAANPAPQLRDLQPTKSQVQTSGTISLQVIGANFESSSVILVNSAVRPTTYVNPTILTTSLSGNDLSTSGILNVAVMNPAPGGGTTSSVQFKVEDYTFTGPPAATKVTAGIPANFTFTLAPGSGGFSSPVTFAISTTLPAGTEPSFLPSATITPNTSMPTVTLSISTSPHTAASLPFSSRRRSIRQETGRAALYWNLPDCVFY